MPDPENRGVGEHSVQLSFTGTELYRFEVPIGMQIFLKFGVKWGRNYQIFIPNKLDLTFRAPDHCAKFCQDRIKIAVVGVPTDRLTEYLQSVLQQDTAHLERTWQFLVENEPVKSQGMVGKIQMT